MSNAATSHAQALPPEMTVRLADGTEFDVGVAGTRRHQRRVRKLIRIRLKHEPAFRAAYADRYTPRGKLR